MKREILAALVCAALTAPAFAEPAKEKVKQAADEANRATKNAGLTGRVKSALAADVGLKTVKIDVDSADGIVTLKGYVDSEDTRRRVEATAKKVSGVTQVHNELHAKN